MIDDGSGGGSGDGGDEIRNFYIFITSLFSAAVYRSSVNAYNI